MNSELYQFPTMGIGVFYNVSYHTGGILVQYIMLTNVTNYYHMTFSIENRNQMAIQTFVFLLPPTTAPSKLPSKMMERPHGPSL